MDDSFVVKENAKNLKVSQDPKYKEALDAFLANNKGPVTPQQLKALAAKIEGIPDFYAIRSGALPDFSNTGIPQAEAWTRYYAETCRRVNGPKVSNIEQVEDPKIDDITGRPYGDVGGNNG